MTSITHTTQQRDRYEALFENSSDAILILSGGRFVDCNRAAIEMLRSKDKASVLQTHPSKLSPEYQPDGRLSFEKADEMIAIAIERGTHRFEWDHKRMDGEVFPVEVLLTCIPRGDDIEIHTVWRDISERKALEKRLRHAQKLEVIGKLSSGFAHEFNNYLVPIIGCAEMLREHLSSPADLSLLDNIEKAGLRASALVNKLAIFSQKDEREFLVFNLQEAVEQHLGLISNLVGQTITINLDCGAQGLPVQMAPEDIELILLNLASNAQDAMLGEGEITITLSRTLINGSGYACLEFSDTGIGMDATLAGKIFEPFFTTKSSHAEGTGLGLATIANLMSQVNGLISVKSEPGKGASFTLQIPLYTGNEKHSAVPLQPIKNTQPDHVPEPASILVVDDDEGVAQMLTSILVNAGHQVKCVHDGAQGFELAMNEAFDLIVTDIVMPVKSGPQMARELEQNGCAVPILFISGYTDERLEIHGFDANTVNILKKPFTSKTLLNKIYPILDNSLAAH